MILSNFPTKSGLTQEQADARYLQLTGGTMTGPIYVVGNDASPFTLFSIAKDSTGGTFVKVGSDGVGGTLFLFDSLSGGKGALYIRTDGNQDNSPCRVNNIATPVKGADAANKAYVDSREIYHVDSSAPSNTNLLWIDTNSTTGGLKYYNGNSWVHVPVAYS